MPVPKAPPPGARVQPTKPKSTAAAPQPTTDSRAVNDVLPFLAFVEKHPVGSKVKCLVDSYSAHGAYVSVDGIKAYAPLRLLGSPPPRSARDALKLGQVVQLVIAGYTPSRRSVEVGVVEAVKVAVPVKAGEPVTVTAKKQSKTVVKKVSAAKKTVTAKKIVAAKKAVPVKKTEAKKIVAAKKAVAGKVAPAKKVAAKKAGPAKKAAKKAASKK
jgi:ribosomal protein S1